MALTTKPILEAAWLSSSVETIPPLSASDIERFWSHVDVRGPDECWPWKLRCNIGGYGQFSIKAIPYPAHRVVYLLQHNADPGCELDVLHSCDNPPCCNPNHHHIGTALENNRERSIRGRSASGERHWTKNRPVICPDSHPFRQPKQGELNPRARLTSQDVLEIRRSFAAKDATSKQLAVRFCVSRSMIYQIVSRATWTHI